MRVFTMRIIKRWKAYLLFLMLSILPFVWLRSHPIAHWDTNYGLISPFIKSPNTLVFLWDFAISTGRDMTFYHSTLFPLAVFYKFLLKTPGSINYKQAFELSLILFISLIAMYHLAMDIFKNISKKEIAGTFAALFYIFNFATFFWFFSFHQPYIYTIPFLPLFLLALKRGIENNSQFYAVLTAMLTAVSSAVFFNPAYGLATALIALCFYIYYGGYKKKKFTLIFVILVFILNIFWIIPALESYRHFHSEASILAPTIENFEGSTRETDLLHSFILIPKSTLWFYEVNSEPWSHEYHSGYLFILGFCFVIIIFASLLIVTINANKSSRRDVLFLATLALLGVLLVNSGNPPFGKIMWLFFRSRIPFLPRIFSFAIQKFVLIVILPYSLLLGYTVANLYILLESYSGKVAKFIMLGALFFVLLFGYPLINGKALTSNVDFGGADKTAYVKVPEYYHQASHILDSQQEYRVLILPLSPSNMRTYNWKYGYLGEPFEDKIFNRPIFAIRAYEQVWDKGTKLLNYMLESGHYDPNALYRLFTWLNIKYVIIEDDINWINGNYFGKNMMPPQKYVKVISNMSGITLKEIIKNITIYEITDHYPHIYASSFYVYLQNGSLEDIPSLLEYWQNTTIKLMLFSSVKGDATSIDVYNEIRIPVYNGSKTEFEWEHLTPGKNFWKIDITLLLTRQ